jgi:hypothetical protein
MSGSGSDVVKCWYRGAVFSAACLAFTILNRFLWLCYREQIMNETAVQDILDRIQRLPQADRILLEERLAELAEAEWKCEAQEARRKAKEQGFDQATIDKAIEELRYST